MGIEFYTYGEDVWYIQDGRNARLTEESVEIINYLIDKMQSVYPRAYKALEGLYSKSVYNVRYYQFLIAKRFVKCNFGELDATKIDITDSMNLEVISCPLRGECPLEGIVCKPIVDSRLSAAEERIARKLSEGEAINDIAESLFISPSTVKNHIKSVYQKWGVHDKGGFYKKARILFT